MSKFCIPPKIAANLKEAARVGAIKIAEMYDMTPLQRRELFEKYVDKDMARNINAGFEKAMASKQTKTLTKWVEDTFTGEAKKHKKVAMDKILELEKEGLINPTNSKAFLEDLVATKLGIYVTADEVAALTLRAKKIEEISKRDLGQTGNHSNEYFKETTALQDYIDSLTPSSQISVTIQTTMRGNMLTSPASVVANMAFNTVQAVFEQTSRILAEAATSAKKGEGIVFKGANSKKVNAWVKEEVKRYNETGVSLSRALDSGDIAPKILGEKKMHSQGPGAARAIARFYEDVVFKKMQGTFDVATSAAAFGWTTNLLTTKWAKREGFKGKVAKEKASELFDLVTSLDPYRLMEQRKIKNDSLLFEAQKIREQAIMDAMTATNTQNSNVAQMALKLRDALDSGAPNIKVGSILAPFVKTPANALKSSMDYSGAGAIRGLWNLMSRKTKNNPELWTASVRDIVRSGLGLTAGMYIYAQMQDGSLTGEYDPSKKDIREAQGAIPNSFRIGNSIISMDYLGPIKAPLQGLLAADILKGDLTSDPGGKIWKYAAGTVGALATTPGVAEYDELFTAIKNAPQLSPEEAQKDTIQWLANFLAARTIPAVVQSIAKATDPYERKPNKDDVGGQVLAKIPGLRQTQPIKKDFAGNPIKTENPLVIFFFGSRVKTARESAIVKEYDNLDKQGIKVPITNLDRPTGNLKDLKKQLGDTKWNDEVKQFYQTTFADETAKVINTTEYKRLTTDEKESRLNRARAITTKKTLTKYGFKKPKTNDLMAKD